jgi:hypothetical protein
VQAFAHFRTPPLTGFFFDSEVHARRTSSCLKLANTGVISR